MFNNIKHFYRAQTSQNPFWYDDEETNLIPLTQPSAPTAATSSKKKAGEAKPRGKRSYAKKKPSVPESSNLAGSGSESDSDVNAPPLEQGKKKKRSANVCDSEVSFIIPDFIFYNVF